MITKANSTECYMSHFLSISSFLSKNLTPSFCTNDIEITLNGDNAVNRWVYLNTYKYNFVIFFIAEVLATNDYLWRASKNYIWKWNELSALTLFREYWKIKNKRRDILAMRWHIACLWRQKRNEKCAIKIYRNVHTYSTLYKWWMPHSV